ncbi:MAG: PRC-barrel domain containing protein [bacterium]
MTRVTTLVATAVLSVGLGVPAFADATKQTITLTQVDPASLATGWRATDIIGKLEDMIITDAGTVPYTLVSVGGFLGMDARHVVVAVSALEMVAGKLTLHAATKETLTALPNFTFTK